jgi:hypothetical protein
VLQEMPKSKYERERDANIKSIQDVCASLGIDVLAEIVNSTLSKEQEGKGKALESEKPESDNDYDPKSDLDNLSDSEEDCDYDDDLNTEVRCISRSLNNLTCLYICFREPFVLCLHISQLLVAC